MESLHFLFLHLYVPSRVDENVCATALGAAALRATTRVSLSLFHTLNKPLRVFYSTMHIEQRECQNIKKLDPDSLQKWDCFCAFADCLLLVVKRERIAFQLVYAFQS